MVNLSRYRQDSAFPNNAASMTSGFSGGISVYSKPLIQVTGITDINPNVTQSQDNDPRATPVNTSAATTIYPTFNTSTFVIFGIIIVAIWFLAR